MKAYKIRVGKNRELSELVQKHAFKLGYTWIGDPDNKSFYEAEYIYLTESHHMGYGNEKNWFEKEKSEEVLVPDFLMFKNEFKFGDESLIISDENLIIKGSFKSKISLYSYQIDNLVKIYEEGFKLKILGREVEVSKGRIWVDGEEVNIKDCEALISAIKEASTK